MSDWRSALNSAHIIACDIEISNGKLSCFGFAISPHKSYVIPASKIHIIKEICESSTPKVWANGKFDLYFLKYRCGIDVKGEVHDVMAAWFALYPELAGSAENKKKKKMTRKSLSFLASLFTYDAWWKGDYSNEHEFFIYNGKDCCITYDVWNHLEAEIKSRNVGHMYDHVRNLVWPCVDMLERGLLVDEDLRQSRIKALQSKALELKEALNASVNLEDLKDAKLFYNIEPTCKCCRHSSKKQQRCWSCAGFEKAPSKRELVERLGTKSLTKDALESALLGVCTVCNGTPRREWLEWNPSSHHQNKVVLYDVLKLPKRFKDGKLRSDEEALKGLLGNLKGSNNAYKEEVLHRLLVFAKSDTMRAIYGRILPAEDGRIHSDQSPYGTETSRFSHSETFLYTPGSTNLANLPKKTASGEELYRVRDCIIPEPGRSLLKADYSAAEARWCAWMAGDTKRIDAYLKGIDLYKVYVALLKWEDESRWVEVDKTERNVIGKVGILSGQYGVSWKTIQDAVNADADLTGIAIDAKTAKKMVDIWEQFFPETLQWHAKIREQVLSKGYIENPYGFRRYFFGRKDSNAAKDAVVREAIAFGPQSANAMMVNKALASLYYKHDPHDLRILLQVHDEIVLDCAKNHTYEVAKIIKDTMETDFEIEGRVMRIPAEIELCNNNWADACPIEV